MKRLHLSSLFLLLLRCGGGQSGDDGDVRGPADEIPRGVPCDLVETEVAWDAATPFGGSALDALNRLTPNESLPFYWVPFDSVPDTTFSPGPGTTALAFGIGARADAAVTYLSWSPKEPDASCPDETLQLPVQVQLKSADGAMDLSVAGQLQLTSGSAGHVRADLPTDLGGSFHFEQFGPPEQHWRSTGFELQADLWPGGSNGALIPSWAVQASDLTRGGPPAAPGTLTPAGPLMIGPHAVQWIGIWPRPERCAYLPGDRVIGLSVAGVVSELDSRSDWTLRSDERELPVQFTLELPTGLQCVAKNGRSMSFDVTSTLSAGPATGAPLEHLAASSVFTVTATSTLDGAALEGLHWFRKDYEESQTREAFEANTGITLDAADEYQQIWWSWHGKQTRANPSAPWSSSGALLVNSLNAQQAAELARRVAQGGSGRSTSFDWAAQAPRLPGDTLLEADITGP
jgi:hypothetical protein